MCGQGSTAGQGRAVGVIIAGLRFGISGGEKKGETIAVNMEFENNLNEMCEEDGRSTKHMRELASSSTSQSNLRGGAVCILLHYNKAHKRLLTSFSVYGFAHQLA